MTMVQGTGGAAADDALRVHIAQQWPDRPHEEFTWRLGPMYERYPEFRVRRIAPTGPDDGWAYVTIGAWVGGDGPERTEFFLLSPVEEALHVETLAMLSYYHLDPTHPLRVGDSLAIGRPWLEGSNADRVIVTPAYSLPEDFELCSVGDLRITYRWLVPITEQESVYASEQGFAKLEERFEKSEVDLLNAVRPSLVMFNDEVH